MEVQAVGFDTYGGLSSNTGNITALGALIRALCSERFPVKKRAYRILLTMLLSTLYLASMPTLFSAMTGYAAVSGPSVEMPPPEYQRGAHDLCKTFGGCEVFPCGSKLAAGWGVVLDPLRYTSDPPSSEFSPNFLSVDSTDPGKDYYYAYKQYYDAAAIDPACQNVSAAECPILNIASNLTVGNTTRALSAPMLSIQLFSTGPNGVPNDWICDGLDFRTMDLQSGNATGFCQAGANYQWGFSFLLTFIVSILNFLFVVTIYALWIDATRNMVTLRRQTTKQDAFGQVSATGISADFPSILSNATNMVRQAEDVYGEDVRKWSAKKLEEDVWRGKVGMRAP